jgi:hypothetical protein
MFKPNYSELNLKESFPKGIEPQPQMSCPCNKEGLHPPHIRKKSANKNLQTSNPNTHMFSCTSKLIICNQNQDISLQAII